MTSGPPRNSSTEERVVSQEFFDVKLCGDGVVWLVRRPVPYPSIGAVHGAYDDFLKLVDNWLFEQRIKSGEIGKRVRSPMGWLYDLRGVPDLRNDPEFEKAVQSRRPELLKRSPALGILVATAAGRMQLTRLTRQVASNVRVFDDAEEAVLWVQRRMREP